jgi:hypothetical protein
MVVFDDHSLPYLLPAASLPLLVLALVRGWPRRAATT